MSFKKCHQAKQDIDKTIKNIALKISQIQDNKDMFKANHNIAHISNSNISFIFSSKCWAVIIILQIENILKNKNNIAEKISQLKIHYL